VGGDRTAFAVRSWVSAFAAGVGVAVAAPAADPVDPENGVALWNAGESASGRDGGGSDAIGEGHRER
jgi:hypothetical protein